MPELPDIELYRVRLEERLKGEILERVLIANPFVVRSVAPAPPTFELNVVTGVERIGKRLVLAFAGERFIVIHLMIAGRLQWQAPLPPLKRAAGKIQLASLRFTSGQLSLIEFSTKKRASIYFVEGREALAEHSRGGMDVRLITPQKFGEIVRQRNRTLKRVLTDPSSFDGIGNAFSDEILFHARLSPVRMSQALSDEEVSRLHQAAGQTLDMWIARLQNEFTGFPKPSDITAFRPDYAVHGRFGLPCPTCGKPIQRIVYAENETNYCAVCQNEGRLLADRSLSRLLKDDWPRTLDEMVDA